MIGAFSFRIGGSGNFDFKRLLSSALLLESSSFVITGGFMVLVLAELFFLTIGCCSNNSSIFFGSSCDEGTGFFGDKGLLLSGDIGRESFEGTMPLLFFVNDGCNKGLMGSGEGDLSKYSGDT